MEYDAGGVRPLVSQRRGWPRGAWGPESEG